MSYALTTIWYERQRFLPAILAVAFSAVLMALQSGIVLGLLTMMSLPVDHAAADLWVGFPGVRSVDLGRPVPERWWVSVAGQPEIVQVEPIILGFSLWTRPGPSPSTTISEVCTVVGTRLHPQGLAVVRALREAPELLSRLSEPGTVVIDRAELTRLGVQNVGQTADVYGVRVRVVGLVDGCKSLGGPYVFCSLETARQLLRYSAGEATYLVARVTAPHQASRVAQRLQTHYRMTALTADEFSLRSRWHWLVTTKAGIAVGFTALLGLLVGAVVTSQTLYAATAASKREYSTLRAMGIPKWRLQAGVLAQSFWVGCFGLLLAAPVAWLLAEGAVRLGTAVRWHPWIIA
ncbi:MAG: ABC transporter permease, partial [Gemmataceae bacterium]|nr:ABC transporter permease [Gemmataceae bacterium]